MNKVRKSIFKRMRITKNDRILGTRSGINHFQAKKSRSSQLTKKHSVSLSKIQKRMIKDYINY